MLLGADGLPARETGEWGELKLAFLDWYGPPALDATVKKHRRGYLDLFAGPGVNITEGRESEGAALRALRMRGRHQLASTFTDAILVNLNRQDDEALRARVDRLVGRGECRVPRDRIRVVRDDANKVVRSVMGGFHRLDYLLVFADLEAPRQWPWSSIEALCAAGHESVDLYMLFPLEMGITRLLAYDEAQRDKYGAILTRFFGNDRWRAIAAGRYTEAFAAEFRSRLLELYLSQLRRHWQFAGEVMQVRLRGRQSLYRMLFASNHEAGARIAAWARSRALASPQGELGL